MKKNGIKKLTDVRKLKKIRLSRETLHVLTSSDVEKMVGGEGPISPQSWQLGPCPCLTQNAAC